MDLKKERENLIAQRDNAYAVYQQTIGALALIDILIQEQDNVGSISMEELQAVVDAIEE